MIRTILALLLVSSVVLSQIPIPTPTAVDLLNAHNAVRANPKSLVPVVQAYRNAFNAASSMATPVGKPALTVLEGAQALDEAIAFLNAQAAVPPLTLNDKMTQAALLFAQDIGGRGVQSHIGADGSTLPVRLQRVGKVSAPGAENDAYGIPTAEWGIVAWIVDSNFPTRGHRVTIFNPDLKVVGFGCAPHKSAFGNCCVADFAAAMV